MNTIERQLHNKGVTRTNVRTTISRWIMRHEGVFSVPQILAAHKEMDKVSAYRTIQLFSDLDIIHPVLAKDGVQFYELHGPDHHHHVVCTQCEKSICVPCDFKPTIRGFSDLHHTIVMEGICTVCSH